MVLIRFTCDSYVFAYVVPCILRYSDVIPVIPVFPCTLNIPWIKKFVFLSAKLYKWVKNLRLRDVKWGWTMLQTDATIIADSVINTIPIDVTDIIKRHSGVGLSVFYENTR